jgi:hypothetical protein
VQRARAAKSLLIGGISLAILIGGAGGPGQKPQISQETRHGQRETGRHTDRLSGSPSVFGIAKEIS